MFQLGAAEQDVGELETPRFSASSEEVLALRDEALQNPPPRSVSQLHSLRALRQILSEDILEQRARRLTGTRAATTTGMVRLSWLCFYRPLIPQPRRGGYLKPLHRHTEAPSSWDPTKYFSTR